MQAPPSLLSFAIFIDEPEPREVATRLTIIAVMCLHSAWLVSFLERAAEHYNEAPLSRVRRYLIPLPILLLLAAVLAAIMHESPSFANPGHLINPAGWDPDWSGWAGIISLAVTPFLLVRRLFRAIRLSLFTWCMHLLWVAVSFGPFALTTLHVNGLLFRK